MKSGTELAQKKEPKNLSRTHSDYWLARVVKREYDYKPKDAKKAQEFEVSDYSVRMNHLGKREWFSLRTANKSSAAATARNIYLSLVGRGWDATIAEFKPDMVVSSSESPTVGEFLDRVRTKIGINSRITAKTFAVYQKKFRGLIADMFNIEGTRAKFYHAGDAYKKWLERVHAIKLQRLTPERVNEWMNRHLDAAASNPLKLKQATNTVRSILLNAKSLFSDDFRKDLGLPLPDPLPFDGITIPAAPKNRYKSKINPGELLRKAQTELAPNDPEAFKVILLTLGCGLRRGEVDLLPWTAIQWSRNTIVIETTVHSAPKSEDSENDVSVDPGLMDILKSLMPKPGDKAAGEFVIASQVVPRPDALAYHYRCTRIFKRVAKWLRANGVSAQKPLHNLRKEFGSQVCAAGGIYSASRQLRHSSIVLTREYYADSAPAVFEISKLLNEQKPESKAQRL